VPNPNITIRNFFIAAPQENDYSSILNVEREASPPPHPPALYSKHERQDERDHEAERVERVRAVRGGHVDPGSRKAYLMNRSERGACGGYIGCGYKGCERCAAATWTPAAARRTSPDHGAEESKC
jgi:hypothetical protein